MRVEILCTGDEILTGKTINTNYSHMARRLGDVGLDVHWGTTVGDDRASLLQAFRQAGERADAVIVNGGLGPTVDDLSQEVAAEACGVPLVLSDYWMTRMTESYARRGRVMPPNNKKQAMLPAGAEFIDNPIGTACGFAVTIGKARFLFTPGVPREMRRMLDEQVIPRLLALSGIKGVTKLKALPHLRHRRIARRRVMLAGIPGLAIDGDIKLGFQAHYPQLETKLTARGANEADLARLAPVEAEVRKRLGNFIIAEDDQTMEGIILAKLREGGHTLAVGRDLHRRQHRRPHRAAGRRRDGVPARDRAHPRAHHSACRRAAESHCARRAAPAMRWRSLVELDEGPDRPDFGGHDHRRHRRRQGHGLAPGAAGRRPRLGARRAPPNWGSTACAAICSACRSTSASTSSGYLPGTACWSAAASLFAREDQRREGLG